MHKVISFGHRCTTASFLKMLNLKTESYPFDWVVSKLQVIQHCIETSFQDFLNVNNYITVNTETYNLTDNIKTHVCYETIQVNKFYENGENRVNGEKSTYSYQLALTHHNLCNDNDTEYFKRCVDRLYELFLTDTKKYYVYFHPVIGNNDFTNNQTILDDFENFNKFIIKQTNIFGIYFIPIKYNSTNEKSIKIKETDNYVVFVLYCDDNFIDGGGTFSGNYHAVEVEALTILNTYFM